MGDGCGGRPARGGLGDENSACLPAPAAARVLIVPAFSLANGSESDSVLELDWKKEGMIKKIYYLRGGAFLLKPVSRLPIFYSIN